MWIGKLAKRSGTLVTTIRYYERIGLLDAPPRTASGYRAYTQAHLKRLNFIRRGRELGFPLGAIRELIALDTRPGDASAASVDSLIARHLAEVEARMFALRHLAQELRELRIACTRGASSRGGIARALLKPKASSRARKVSVSSSGPSRA